MSFNSEIVVKAKNIILNNISVKINKINTANALILFISVKMP